jgi:hypothetical protein
MDAGLKVLREMQIIKEIKQQQGGEYMSPAS